MTIRWIHSKSVSGLLVIAAVGVVLISQIDTQKPLPVFTEPETSTEVNSGISLSDYPEQIEIRPANRQAHVEVVEQLPSVIRVYGTITDESNAPIESVVVQAGGAVERVVSNDRGGYKINLASGLLDSVSLVFLRSGYEAKTVSLSGLDIDHEYSLSYDVKLEYSPDSVTVDGWLSDVDGHSVAGQLVELRKQGSEDIVTALSDERGKFSFEAVTLGVDYQLKVESSGAYTTYSRQYPQLSARMLPLFISLETLNLKTIQGVVIDSYGLPVPNFMATARNMEMREYTASLNTDELGRFTLQDFPLGEILFKHNVTGLLNISRIETTELTHDRLVVPVDFGTRHLSGWVRDRYGKPVVSARVVLDAKRVALDVFVVSTRMEKTDSNGYYEFMGLSDAEYNLTVYASGFINHGIRYHPGTGIDQLYFQLSRWSEGL